MSRSSSKNIFRLLNSKMITYHVFKFFTVRINILVSIRIRFNVYRFHFNCFIAWRTVGAVGGQGAFTPPIIFSDLNLPFFKWRICEFLQSHSFSSRKLLPIINKVCFHQVLHKIMTFPPLIDLLILFFYGLVAYN